MIKEKNNHNQLQNSQKSESLLFDSIKVLSDLTRKDIERLYNVENMKGSEISYSDRNGWYLRKVNA